MTGRERLLRAFRGQKVDRVPIIPFVYKNFVYDFFGTVELDLAEKTIEVHDYFGFDLLHRTQDLWDCFSEPLYSAENWKVEKKVESRGDVKVEITIIKTPEKELRQVREFSWVSKYLLVDAITEHFIKDWKKDFEQFVKYMPPVSQLDGSKIKRTRELMGEKGLYSTHFHGAFNLLNNYLKYEDMLMLPILDRVLFDEMVTFFSDRAFQLAKQEIEAGSDIITYAGNLATSTALGKKNYIEFVFEHERRLIKKLKDAGAIVLYHNCGDAQGLLDVYSGVEMDAFETLTHPPFADTIFEDALEKIDKKIILMGYIDQTELLMKGTPEDVKKEVKYVVEKGKERGNFILGTADFLLNGTPHKNLKALVEAGLEYGQY